MYSLKEALLLNLEAEHLVNDECGCYTDDEGFHPCPIQQWVNKEITTNECFDILFG